MAAADGDYYTHANVKILLNIPASNTDSDDKINIYGAEADNYINTQVSMHAAGLPLVITARPALEVGNLADSLAAGTFNYWQSPQKDDKMLNAITKWEGRIQDFIKAFYANMSASGITNNTFSKTASLVTGTET